MAANTKLNNDAKLLLAANSLNRVTDLFLGTFFISFIMHNSINEIVSVSLYKLFVFIVILAGFFALAGFVKRKDKVAVFRMNVIPKIACLLAIIFLKDRVIDYVIHMGVIYGLATALYWSPMHCMVGEKVASGAMTKYIGYNSMVMGLTQVISPIILGLFITVGSYEEMARALIVICLVELALTFFIKPSMHRSKNKVDLKGFFRCTTRFPIIRKLFSIEILQGFSWAGAIGTIITMHVVYMFKTDLMLGIFTTAFSIVAIITSFWFGKFGKKSVFPKIFFATFLATLCTLPLFLFYTSEVTFLAYNFVQVSGMGLLSQIVGVNMYCLSKSSCVSKDHKTEYFVFREAALGLGRMLSFATLLLIGIIGGLEWLKWYLAVLVAVVLLMGYWSIKINQHIK
ncbi:MAG: MFS transporter [Alphaproteobacteria bacterium]|nr:MFS transporter [Alphaproteobacteria bacterium]